MGAFFNAQNRLEKFQFIVGILEKIRAKSWNFDFQQFYKEMA